MEKRAKLVKVAASHIINQLIEHVYLKKASH